MKYVLALSLLSAALFSADIAMPKFQKYYISGIEFDTQTYCADFANVINVQQQKIKSLEAQVAQLHTQLQAQMKRNAAQKKLSESTVSAENTPRKRPAGKSKIIISDKPI